MSLKATSPFPSPFPSYQIASFSKYISKSRAKHLPLNTKRAGKGYKKGYGARTEGIVTSKAKFIPVAAMRTELVVPDLSDFKVRLNLSHTTSLSHNVIAESLCWCINKERRHSSQAGGESLIDQTMF
jgi:hypothetical protein